MGLLDELKKLTKPYDDEDYLEENLTEPVRVGTPNPANRSYASYAEPPRAAEQPQQTRRPYVFSRNSAQPQQNQTYAQTNGYDGYGQQGYPDGYAPQGYAQPQQGYAQQSPYGQRQPYAMGGYAQQGAYAQPGYAQPQQSYPQQNRSGGYGASPAPQAKLLLVRPDRFEVAADIADRISDRNAIVLNLEQTDKDTARRMLDFLSGVTYALGGNIKKVSGSTYVITPSGMDFMGDGLEEMDTREKYF